MSLLQFFAKITNIAVNMNRFPNLTNLICVYRAVKKKQKAVKQLGKQLMKLEAARKDEKKNINLAASKLNYLDPRISVAW